VVASSLPFRLGKPAHYGSWPLVTSIFDGRFRDWGFYVFYVFLCLFIVARFTVFGLFLSTSARLVSEMTYYVSKLYSLTILISYTLFLWPFSIQTCVSSISLLIIHHPHLFLICAASWDKSTFHILLDTVPSSVSWMSHLCSFICLHRGSITLNSFVVSGRRSISGYAQSMRSVSSWLKHLTVKYLFIG